MPEKKEQKEKKQPNEEKKKTNSKESKTKSKKNTNASKQSKVKKGKVMKESKKETFKIGGELTEDKVPSKQVPTNEKSAKYKNTSKKEFKTMEVAVLVILTCMISLIVGGILGSRVASRKWFGVEVADPAIQDFIKDYNYLIENYYGSVDKKELLNTAFKSMVDSLEDSYSGTIDENTSNNLNIELKGSYEGLGIEIVNDSDNNILIYSVIPNSPASKVDLMVGDKLITVNGTSVTGMLTTDFINKVVKESNATTFNMIIERNGAKKTIVLEKETITLQSVHSKTYEENGKKIGYLKVDIFATNTDEQFKSELHNLEYMGIDSLIIDLRDNSGGHLTSVENMLSLFLDSSHVIYQTQNKDKKNKVYSNGKETKDYPIVIIGNAMSASAAEVMIGALTEEYGAVLVGNQTFGKGTVQELHELSNGDAYKFTTKKWLTPKGKWVHNDGIMPTIEVTLAKEYYGNPIEENDNQLKAALDYLKTLK